MSTKKKRVVVKQSSSKVSEFDAVRSQLSRELTGLVQTQAMVEDKFKPVLRPEIDPSEQMNVIETDNISDLIAYMKSWTSTVRSVKNNMKKMIERCSL